MSKIDKLTTLFLAVLFAFAGLDKLAHLHGFINAINSYRILPVPIGSTLAPLLIAAELAIAVGLLRSSWRRTASLQACGLMTVFTLALVMNRILGGREICGCWFSINMAEGNNHLALNLLIILLSLFVWHAAAGRMPSGSRPLA